MKRIVPFTLVVTIVCVIGLGIAFAGIYVCGSQGEAKVTTILGEKSAIDDIHVSFASTADEYFNLQETVSFGDETQVKCKVEPMFHTGKDYSLSYMKRLYVEESGTFISNLYYLMRIGFHFDPLDQATGPHLKVSIPQAVLNEIKDSALSDKTISYVTDQDNIQNEVDSCYADGRYYFTMFDTFLQEGITIGDRVYPDLIYEGNTGLYSVECNDDGSFPFIHHHTNSYGSDYYDIDNFEANTDLKLPISNETSMIEFGMNAVFEDSMIALAMKEGDQVYLYLYDTKLQCGLGKYPFFELPENAVVTKADISSDQDMLMLTGEYYLKGEPEASLKRYFAVTKVIEKPEDTMNIELQYFVETDDPTIMEALLINSIFKMHDFCWRDGDSYCLFGQNMDEYIFKHYANYLLKFSNQGIEYLGTFVTEFEDDDLIGSTRTNDGWTQKRIYDQLRFID